MKRWVSFWLAVSLLAVPALPASAQTCATSYTVKAGDNLYRIGLAHGIKWTELAAANHLTNPNLIFVGQVLCIPAMGTPGPSATPGASATPTPTAAPAATPVSGPTAVPTTAPPAGGVPTFAIVSVTRNLSVTVRTANFPANQVFDVTMGPIGALGVGYVAGTVNSGAGGVLTATLGIPAPLANAAAISVRLQNTAGYYSYGWFYNTTFP
ncbi:MAG: LysM peptidoglycan-binding domain-containing protein [Anaerolineales bacterium]|nr:LysM peptidoglycan-binding domain-containing protein [Anaerolineales bacterium]